MSVYTVLYPDGSHSRINEAKRKEMEREGLLFRVNGGTFRYTGDAFHFRNLADLRLYHAVITSTVRFKNYPGLFIWLHEHRRVKETLEPPESMAARLKAQGAVT